MVFLSVFSNQWQASISSNCILTPMSCKIEETVFSNWLSCMLSGIPDKNKLFLLPYCPNEFRFCYILLSVFHFHPCNHLITISLRLTISSFKLLIQLMIFSSSFTSGPWLEAPSLSETLPCQCLVLYMRHSKKEKFQNKSNRISVISATDSIYQSFMSFHFNIITLTCDPIINCYITNKISSNSNSCTN